MPDRQRGGLLLLASLLTGIFGAATIYLARAYLGLESFVPLAQLWTMWSLLSASLTFGVQHRVARALVRTGSLDMIRRQIVLNTVGVTAVVTALSLAFSGSWFDDDRRYAAIAAALVVGTAANGVARGAAAVASTPRTLAAIIVGENAIRLILIVPLVAFGAGPLAFAGALVAGFGVAVFGLRPARLGVAVPAERKPDSGGMVATATLGLVSFSFASSGPLLLAPLGEEAAAVSALFLVITLARVPYVVVLGLLPAVSVQFEQLARGEDWESFRRFVNRVGAASLIGAASVGIVALGLADATFGRLLGTTDHIDGSVYALVGASSLLALGGLVISLAFISISATRALAVIWLVPTTIMSGAVAVGWLNSVDRLAGLLFAIEAWLLVVLWWQFRRRMTRAIASSGEFPA